MNTLETEKALLGAVLLEPFRLDDCQLSAEDFSTPTHKLLWREIQEARSKGEEADLITLGAKHPDFAIYISDLPGCCPVPAYAPRYAKMIRDASVMKSLSGLGAEMALWPETQEASVETRLEEAESRIYAIANATNENNLEAISEGMKAHVSELESNLIKGIAPGLYTEFRGIDEKTRGLRGGELCILAARPGVGKTTLALNICSRIALKNPVAFVSLEMTTEELRTRLICAEAGVDSSTIRGARISVAEFDRYKAASEKLESLQLFIHDTHTDLVSLKNMARQAVHRYGCKLLVLDYLQLLYIRGGRGSRYEEVTEISREMKLLSKSLQIPIIALSQLSRSSEKEGKRKPRLSDLRESGAIEQDADLVMFLHTEDEQKYELMIAKNRSGPTGTAEIKFDKRYSRFQEYSL